MDFSQDILSEIIAAEKEGARCILGARNISGEDKSSHRDVVTKYDRQVQALLIERLSAAVPGAKFFCEENDLREHLDEEHVFVIDPIDGTMNFVHGFNHSCISVAYFHRQVPTLAGIYDPYADEMFSAAKDKGAWLNGRPIHVFDGPMEESVCCYGTAPYNSELTDETFRLARIAFDNSLDIRRGGSAALDLCFAAAGRAGVYFEAQTSLWDFAAGMLIVQEAGGACLTLKGEPMPLDGSKASVVAGGRRAVEEFLRKAERK